MAACSRSGRKTKAAHQGQRHEQGHQGFRRGGQEAQGPRGHHACGGPRSPQKGPEGGEEQPPGQVDHVVQELGGGDGEQGHRRHQQNTYRGGTDVTPGHVEHQARGQREADGAAHGEDLGGTAGRCPAGDLGQQAGHQLGIAVVGLEKCPAERCRQRLGVEDPGIFGPGRAGGGDARLTHKGHRAQRCGPQGVAGRHQGAPLPVPVGGREEAGGPSAPALPAVRRSGRVTVHRFQDGPDSPHRVIGVPTFQVMTSSASGSLSLR